jgi:tetratricopeptide (TPR) repeat protein
MKEELERVEKTLTFLASDLGKAYEELADYEEAQRYHKYAFEKAQLDNVEIYAGSFAGNLAMLYERLGNLKESEKYHIISLTLNDMIGAFSKKKN